jgi:hypothetical protein
VYRDPAATLDDAAILEAQRCARGIGKHEALRLRGGAVRFLRVSPTAAGCDGAGEHKG